MPDEREILPNADPESVIIDRDGNGEIRIMARGIQKPGRHQSWFRWYLAAVEEAQIGILFNRRLAGEDSGYRKLRERAEHLLRGR